MRENGGVEEQDRENEHQWDEEVCSASSSTVY